MIQDYLSYDESDTSKMLPIINEYREYIKDNSTFAVIDAKDLYVNEGNVREILLNFHIPEVFHPIIRDINDMLTADKFSYNFFENKQIGLLLPNPGILDRVKTKVLDRLALG